MPITDMELKIYKSRIANMYITAGDTLLSSQVDSVKHVSEGIDIGLDIGIAIGESRTWFSIYGENCPAGIEAEQRALKKIEANI